MPASLEPYHFNMEATANTDMREDLEEFSLQRFDLLVENGNILWEPNDAVNVPSSPFPVSRPTVLLLGPKTESKPSSNSAWHQA